MIPVVPNKYKSEGFGHHPSSAVIFLDRDPVACARALDDGDLFICSKRYTLALRDGIGARWCNSSNLTRAWMHEHLLYILKEQVYRGFDIDKDAFNSLDRIAAVSRNGGFRVAKRLSRIPRPIGTYFVTDHLQGFNYIGSGVVRAHRLMYLLPDRVYTRVLAPNWYRFNKSKILVRRVVPVTVTTRSP